MTTSLDHSEQEAQGRMHQIFKLFTELSQDKSYHFDRVLKLATQLVDMEIGIVSCIESETYYIKDLYGAKKYPIKKGQRFPLGETYCNMTYTSNRVIDINHMGELKYQGHPCYKNTKLESYIGVPIWVGNKKYGTLDFSSAKPRKVPFNQFDRDLILYLGQWIGQHITRLEYERQLDEKNRQLQELLDEREKLSSILIHDLKAPLNNLSGLLDLSESMTDEHVISDMMKNSLSHAFNLVTDLQEINQLEQCLTSFDPKVLNAVEAAEIVISQFVNHAQQKGIDLALVVIEESIHVESDMKLLCRSLNNLISNAIKFSKEGTIVEVSVFQEGDQICFKIKDQGPGISKADQKKMFGRFEKLTAQPTGNEHSSGLGLFIVKENCKLLGANISVESKMGHGSIFTLSIPLNTAEEKSVTNDSR